jgi:hypothetical protein
LLCSNPTSQLGRKEFLSPVIHFTSDRSSQLYDFMANPNPEDVT